MGKFIHWAPRVLSIIFVCFLAAFSLDVFDLKLGFWGTLLGLFIHNVPALILLAALLISWKREIVGGIVFILAGVFYISALTTKMLRSSFEWYMVSWLFMVAGPAFLIGILFLINWRRKRSKAN